MSAATRPPLWIWAAAVGLAAATLWGLTLLHRPLQPRVMAWQLNLARFDEAGDRPRVVVLGSSKIQCGVDFDGAMQARLRRAGADVVFNRITYAGGGYEELRYALDRIDASPRPPALVLVEGDQLVYRPHAFNFDPDNIMPWNTRIRADFAAVFRLHGRDNDALGGGPACDIQPAVRSRHPMADFRTALARARISTPAERGQWLARLNRLRGRGVRVLVVTAPRSPAARAVFPPEKVRDAKAVLAELNTRDGLEVIAPPAFPPAQDYTDLPHMNAAGRDAYSAWLAGEIVRRLPTAPAP